jgi:carbon dioxide concentrating mechanism protein CcmN
MHLPTLPLSSNSYVYTEGDVSIDPSAAIAAGVILRADRDSKIVIAAGVCIGMGSILHAHQGTLEVEAGANLGAGVLIVGKGKIGANACIGAVTTIWNASIEPWQVVPSASAIGEKGRQIATVPATSTATPSFDVLDTPLASTSAKTGEDAYPTGKESLNGQAPSNSTVVSTATTDEGSPTEPQAESPNSQSGTSVYGQGSLDRILKTLFPYNNQSLNPSTEDD